VLGSGLERVKESEDIKYSQIGTRGKHNLNEEYSKYYQWCFISNGCAEMWIGIVSHNNEYRKKSKERNPIMCAMAVVNKTVEKKKDDQIQPIQIISLGDRAKNKSS
jgi:hypothetical protein